MSFVEWKEMMLEQGCLKLSRRKDCICYPYTSKHGFGDKYQKFANNATNKGVSNHLTFNDYLYKAYEAQMTHHNQIGTGMSMFQMGRYTDEGDYTTQSCRFILRTTNMMERTSNGGSSRQADKIRGVKNPAKGIKNKGVANYRFVGYYITPNGKFETVELAASANGCGTMTVYDRCKKCDRIISKHATSTIKIYGKSCVGKTYRELGWYFEEV